MSSPLVSIIIPIYNVEKYLQQCLESVVNQSYKNLEIILVDDGSTDNSIKICNQYLKLDRRIIVKHQKNRGLSVARNVGIEMSSGEYISFIDSDDYVSSSFIDTLLSLCINNNANMSACCMSRSDGKPSYYTLKNEVLSAENFINTFFDAAWGKIYKKSIFDNIKFPPGKKHEDQYIYARVAYVAKTIATTEEKLYFYQIRDDNSLSSSTKSTFESEFAIIETIRFINDKNICEKLLNSLMVQVRYRIVYKKIMRKVDSCREKEVLVVYNYLYKKVCGKLTLKSKLCCNLPFLYLCWLFFKKKIVTRIMNKLNFSRNNK